MADRRPAHQRGHLLPGAHAPALHRPALTVHKIFWISVLALVPVLVWDGSGLDLALSRHFATAPGFPLRNAWWLETVLHTDAQRAAEVAALALIALIWLPLGPWRRIARRERLGIVCGVAAAALSISVIKHYSTVSCPWDLQQFGGTAHYVSHWLWGVADGGPGRCFPAGHASTGFAFMAAWFWLRAAAPRTAATFLVGGMASGVLFGGVQVVRGAHYLSHVLWAGWLCWVIGALTWLALSAFWRSRGMHGSQGRC